MERKLLLLGLLRMENMHGYQINDVIDSHMGTSIQLKKATAYDLLRKMEQDGWITHREERSGNRPPRRVYTVTPEGEAAFQRLLRECLAAYQPPEFQSDIGIAFLDALPPAEAIALLRQRQAAITTMRDSLPEEDLEHSASMHLVINRQRHRLTAEIHWLDDVIAHLSAHV